MKIHHAFLLFLAVLITTPIYSQKSTFEKIGDVSQLAIPTIAGISTLILKDKKGTWQLMQSYGTTIAITYALKYTINKKRPNGGDYAFPSGHTASAFSGASFFQRRYGWKYGIPAYAIAVMTGYSRIYAKEHDGWDVLAGAIVGIGSSYIFTTPYQKEHIKLSLIKKDNSYLFGFIYRF